MKEVPFKLDEVLGQKFVGHTCIECVHWKTWGHPGCGDSNWCGGTNPDPSKPPCKGMFFTLKKEE